MTTTEQRLLTADDLFNLPDDGLDHELVRGVLISMPKPGSRHGRLASRATRLIGNTAEPAGLGAVYTDSGFLLARDPDLVRAPDVAFVRGRVVSPEDDEQRYLELVPDLVVAVISPSERAQEVEDRLLDYINAGVKLIWFIYPRTRTISEWRAGVGPARLGKADTLDGSDILPGFQLPVAAIFE